MATQSDYIADLVRREDRDRFLTAMFIPAHLRADVLALCAFNIQLAQIRENVSETMIGRIKLQWWRDVIAGIYDGKGGPKGNPVTEALAGAIQSHGLERAHFDMILETRERDMDSPDEGLVSVVELESYAEGTSSRLLLLVLQVLGVKSEPSISAAKHVGIGYALAGILRAVLFHAHENRLYLPKDKLAAVGVTGVQDLQTERNFRATAKVISELAGIAAAHVTKARTFAAERAAVPGLLLATIAEQHLKLLKRVEYDVSDPRVISARASVALLMWNAWQEKF